MKVNFAQITMNFLIFPKKNFSWDFPGGSMVKNLPATAGDMGSIPDSGKSHMLWSN